jgi:hypothetical protein
MVRRILASIAIAAIVVVSSVVPATAWNASNLALLSIGEDYFYNYDFESESVSSSNADFPVTVLFYNNASVAKVHDIFGGETILGSNMYAYMNDGSGYQWNNDKGSKSIAAHNFHIRTYAANDDRMYNIYWGYYVMSTTHYDYFEWLPWGWSGYSEDAEAEAAQVCRDKGYTVYEDYANFYNVEEPTWQEGKHIWQSNGLATYVNVS